MRVLANSTASQAWRFSLHYQELKHNGRSVRGYCGTVQNETSATFADAEARWEQMSSPFWKPRPNLERLLRPPFQFDRTWTNSAFDSFPCAPMKTWRQLGRSFHRGRLPQYRHVASCSACPQPRTGAFPLVVCLLIGMPEPGVPSGAGATQFRTQQEFRGSVGGRWSGVQVASIRTFV